VHLQAYLHTHINTYWCLPKYTYHHLDGMPKHTGGNGWLRYFRRVRLAKLRAGRNLSIKVPRKRILEILSRSMCRELLALATCGCVGLCLRVSVCLFVCLCLCLRLRLAICGCVCVCLSVCPFVCLSVCLPLSLFQTRIVEILSTWIIRKLQVVAICGCVSVCLCVCVCVCGERSCQDR